MDRFGLARPVLRHGPAGRKPSGKNAGDLAARKVDVHTSLNQFGQAPCKL